MLIVIAATANIEYSKEFAKDLMTQFGIPTVHYQWEVETSEERTGHPSFYTDAKKLESHYSL